MELICANNDCDFRAKFTSPEFSLPFAQTGTDPFAHYHHLVNNHYVVIDDSLDVLYSCRAGERFLPCPEMKRNFEGCAWACLVACVAGA